MNKNRSFVRISNYPNQYYFINNFFIKTIFIKKDKKIMIKIYSYVNDDFLIVKALKKDIIAIKI